MLERDLPGCFHLSRKERAAAASDAKGTDLTYDLALCIFKNGKHIRTYGLDLGPGLIEAITQWANWRSQSGFGDNDAFFLPDRHIQANQAGLGYRPASRL